MNAEKKFKFWMRTLIILFMVLFAYVITADRYAPITTEGRVQGYVVQIAPEISGKVTRVLVENNQKVKAGEPLFTIDDRKYLIKMKKAEISLKSAYEKEVTLYSQREAALARIEQAKARHENDEKEYQRLHKLSKRKVVSQSKRDNAQAKARISEASLKAARQDLKVIEAQLGDAEGQSTAVLSAKNEVDRARLDFSNTVVIAPSDGVITNLQLEQGAMATINSPLLSFVPSRSLWLVADFREKSVASVDENYLALVTFDANPGKVFSFEIKSRDYGVAAAQQKPNGHLSQVASNNRWVRDAQRTRINLGSKEELPSSLFVGSRATVVLYPENSTKWSLLAKLQIGIASWFHFIY